MTLALVAAFLARLLLVALFLPFSALDELLNFRGAVAQAQASEPLARGKGPLDGGGTGRLPGQAPPEAEADASIDGRAGVLHQALALVGSIPDCTFVPQHICSVPCDEGGRERRGPLDDGGPPSRLGAVTHPHIVDGKIVEDWTLRDELSMLTQIKLGDMTRSV